MRHTVNNRSYIPLYKTTTFSLAVFDTEMVCVETKHDFSLDLKF